MGDGGWVWVALSSTLSSIAFGLLGAYLAHRDCDRTAHIYSVGAGKVSRVFIGVTKGVENVELTAESVAAAIDAIDDPASFTIRGGPAAG